MRFNLSPVVRLSLGLVFLTSSIIFLADAIGLVPNTHEQRLEARKQYTEALAIQLAKSAESGHISDMKAVLSTIIEHNPGILSSTIRTSNNTPLIIIGDHVKHWKLKPGDMSTQDQMQIAIYSHNRLWGNFEISYKPITPVTILQNMQSGGMFLSLFVGVIGFLVYYFFLKRSLKGLDPSAVVPNRVRSAMDSLSEGVMILDNSGCIVLANKALGDKLEIEPKKLLGKNPSGFKWRLSDDDKNTTMPWERSIQKNETVTNTPITLETKRKAYSFIVSTSPIANENSTLKGVLITFNDVTQLTKKNNQLQNVVNTLKKSQVAVRQKNRALKLLASLDPLTGCMNRRSFFEAADKAYTKAVQDKQPTSCLMIDIDHFKAVNDTYGHGVGDIVIRQVADVIKNNLREGDWGCRYGGEEFCVYIESAPVSQAEHLAERIRKNVAELDFSENKATKNLNITVSLGLVDSCSHAPILSQLIELADQALYAAKKSGRNKTVIWSDALKKNITESTGVNTEANIENLSSHTSSTTTGRKGFVDRISNAIDATNKPENLLHICVFDIDSFRRINNSLGHQAGDQMINEIMQRLQCFFNNKSILQDYPKLEIKHCYFHLGGDDFGLLIQPNDNAINAADIFRKLISDLTQQFNLDSHEINISYSFGSSTYPTDGKNADEVLRHAEVAMYHAKEKGGNLYEPFQSTINSSSLEKLQLETALRNALGNNEFTLAYQPKINILTKKISGLEALIRWNHPTLGTVPPDQFIPVAEKIGLITDIGSWVLHTACKQAKQWHKLGILDTHVAVNLSALQLKNSNFVAKTISTLNKVNLPPRFLELEVTENILMENLEIVTSSLYRLNKLGIKIAIDDFGTGYSSLSYLKRFPISTLKIDRCFVTDLTNDSEDEAIVKAIIAMAHALNLSVVAEGVETQDQYDKLQQLDCDQIQGYLISRPLRAEQTTELLKNNSLLSVENTSTEYSRQKQAS